MSKLGVYLFISAVFRAIRRLFARRRGPVQKPATKPERIEPRYYRGKATPPRTFGNSLTRSYLPPDLSGKVGRRGSWWIPPDQRDDPAPQEEMRKSNDHRKLLKRIARSA